MLLPATELIPLNIYVASGYKTYRGRYTPSLKYGGNRENVFYRSSWELATFIWLDKNPDVVHWVSEEIVIPYVCMIDKKIHRYFVDLFIKFKNGSIYLVEIKPNAQTHPPRTPKRRTTKYLAEVLTYHRNKSKWDAAAQYAQKHGFVWQIWDEHCLKHMGIKLLR